MTNTFKEWKPSEKMEIHSWDCTIEKGEKKNAAELLENIVKSYVFVNAAFL